MKNNSYKIILLAGLSVAFLYYCWVAFAVLQGFVTNFDEYGYFNQAMLFASGKMNLVPARFNPLLLETHMMFKDGHIFSKYPPGYTLLLVPFITIGLHAAVNPALMAIGWLFTFKTLKSFTHEKAALVITLLAAFNAYSIGYAASLFSQAIAFCLSSIALWAFISYLSKRERKYIYYIGAALAYGFFSRPLDFACLLGALLLAGFLSGKVKKYWADGAIAFGISLIGVLLMVGYNSYQMGQLAFSAYSNVMTSTFFIIDPKADTLIGGLIGGIKQFFVNWDRNMWRMLTEQFLKFTGYTSFVIFLFGVYAIFSNRKLSVFIFYILSIVLIYNFHRSMGWPQYGARYWFAVWGAYVILVGAGWSVIEKLCDTQEKEFKKSKEYKKYKKYHVIKLKNALAALLIIYELFHIITLSPKLWELYGNRVKFLQQAKINADEACPEYSLVVFKVRKYHPVASKDQFLEDVGLKRNYFSDGKRLYLGPYGPQAFHPVYGFHPMVHKHITALQRTFPEYTVCNYQIDYSN